MSWDYRKPESFDYNYCVDQLYSNNRDCFTERDCSIVVEYFVFPLLFLTLCLLCPIFMYVLLYVLLLVKYLVHFCSRRLKSVHLAQTDCGYRNFSRNDICRKAC